MKLSYKDQRSKQDIALLIKKSNLSGEFSSENYSLLTESELYVEHLKTDSVNYLTQKNVHSELNLTIDNSIGSYKIEKGKIKIEDLLFEVVGNIIDGGKQSIVNLGIKGKDMDIRSVLSLVPNQYKSSINDYDSDGEFYFDALIQGDIANGNVPRVTADFGMKNANIRQTKNDVTLKNVSLTGHYFNGDKKQESVLSISPFSALINEGSIKGRLTIQNLDHPSINGQVTADMDLAEIQKFVKIDTIETITGKLKVNADFSADGDFNTNKYDHITTTGDLSILNTNIKLKNNTLEFANINGDFKFDNNDLVVKELKGNVSSSDFLLKGFFRNIMGFILKDDQDITVEATLKSDNINLNELLANKEEDSKSESKYKLKFSEHIDVNLNSEIQHLQFRKFEASNIRGVVQLKDKKMLLDPLTFNAMSGGITVSGLVDGSDSTKLLVNCLSDVNRINITKMYEAFENFGQNTITDKNIKGIATAKIQLTAIFSPELEMDKDKLYALIDMTVDNGELNNVESMKSMSRFIELKELENIRFATLKNQVEIKNQVVSMPRMEIKSSALNILLSGTHTFNDEINYRIKLSLNELLSKKAKAAKKANDEFGEVEDDGLGHTNLFLSMTGTVDNPVIKYDSKSAIQNVQQDLKKEKQTLKTIMKDEFGMFKKDSSLNNKSAPKKEDATKFKINWEEADKKVEEKKELKAPKKDEEEDF